MVASGNLSATDGLDHKHPAISINDSEKLVSAGNDARATLKTLFDLLRKDGFTSKDNNGLSCVAPAHSIPSNESNRYSTLNIEIKDMKGKSLLNSSTSEAFSKFTVCNTSKRDTNLPVTPKLKESPLITPGSPKFNVCSTDTSCKEIPITSNTPPPSGENHPITLGISNSKVCSTNTNREEHPITPSTYKLVNGPLITPCTSKLSEDPPTILNTSKLGYSHQITLSTSDSSNGSHITPIISNSSENYPITPRTTNSGSPKSDYSHINEECLNYVGKCDGADKTCDSQVLIPSLEVRVRFPTAVPQLPLKNTHQTKTATISGFDNILANIKNVDLKKTLKKTSPKNIISPLPATSSDKSTEQLEYERIILYTKLMDYLYLKYGNTDEITEHLEKLTNTARGYLFTLAKNKWVKIYNVIPRTMEYPVKSLKLWRENDTIVSIPVEHIFEEDLGSLNGLYKPDFNSVYNINFHNEVFLCECSKKSKIHTIHKFVIFPLNPPKQTFEPPSEPPSTLINDPKRFVVLDQWRQRIITYKNSDFYQLSILMDKLYSLSTNIVSTKAKLDKMNYELDTASKLICDAFSNISVCKLKSIIDNIPSIISKTLNDLSNRTGIAVPEGSAKITMKFLKYLISYDEFSDQFQTSNDAVISPSPIQQNESS